YGQNAAAYAAREEFRGRAAVGQFGEPPRGLQGFPGGPGGAPGELERGGAAGIAGAGELERRGVAGAAGYHARALEGGGRAESRNAMTGAYGAERRPPEGEAWGRGGGGFAPERGGGAYAPERGGGRRR